MRHAAYIAFFLSGASSLIFQNIWSRMLHHVFGATSVAISTVVTCFMAGLGLGAFIAGRYADRIKHPMITYAVAELGVGVWALLVPILVSPEGWIASLNQALRTSLGAESFGFMIARFVVVAPILLVPTTLMGTTLPLLARHFVESEHRAGTVASRVGVLYAINTFGAVAGINLAGFILLPTVGLAVTNGVALSMNFALAIGIFAFRRVLLFGTWKPGEALEWLPKRKERAAEPDTVPEPPPPVEKEPLDIALPIPPIARKAAFLVFAASGAAALCYEVVWVRALAMTIGSSIYSFALILETFLIGIAGGSAICAALLVPGRHRVTVTAVASFFLLLLANSSWAFRQDFMTYSVVTGVTTVALVATWMAIRARARSGFAGSGEGIRPLLVLLALPVLMAAANMMGFGAEGSLGERLVKVSGALFGRARSGVDYMPIIVCVVVTVSTSFFALMIALRRYPVLLVAGIQFLIAVATFANYLFQDEIPYAFARMVTTIGDLASNVGTVQFFMFLTAGLCTLPAAIGMGAMFPLTMRIWTAGGGNVGRDVGVVYAGNTVGSIVGAWLPGFILMPWKGMEWTLTAGIILNLTLAVVMLVASAAEPEKGKKGIEKDTGAVQPPTWHTVTIYILAPLIPALIALLILHQKVAGPGELARWNTSQMTLGVFRLSLAEDVLNPETWGEPEIVYYKDGLSTTVSVEKWMRHYALKNNGKVDASNGDDMPTQIMVAGFPLLLHEKPPEELDVVIVGFGSGVTVGTALEFPVRSVDVVELERSIPEASMFFEDVNHLEYPGCRDDEDDIACEFPFVRRERLTVINDDGRNYLASTDKTYDIIMSEPSNPWITGVSDLFTTDHFRITKRALKPGGIYCQWVQLYELSPENIKTIYRTFASQFRHVVVFSAEDLSSDTVLLGSDSPLPLDVARIGAPFEIPGVATELERAYVHSPYDILARTILSSRDEVMQYTQIERRLRSGEWIDFPESSNGDATECNPADCQRVGAPLNTDDNALIEFSAPRDLIGFKRYEGYLTNIYSPEWPYGRLKAHTRGFGEGDPAARGYAELAMSLIAHGRKGEASEFVALSAQAGPVQETRVAAEVLGLLLGDDQEPTVPIETPVPGPQLDDRSARQLRDGFASVRQSVDLHAYGTALAAMEEIPSPLRMHSGPNMRFLYGYLLYKAAAMDPARYSEAVEQLEELIRNDDAYVRRHPELYYFLARSHDSEFNFDKALRNMRIYVESRLLAAEGEDLPEPPPGEAPTTDDEGESSKEVHSDQD